MANLKFSDFTPYTTTPLTATSGLVAYEGTTNIRFTPAELAPFTGIYAADGTIGTTRKALITDTIQFRNAGDTSDILKLNTDGTFSLGLGASTTGATQVAIGSSATVAAAHGIAVGSSSNAGSNGISIGQSSLSAIGGIAIGYDSGSSTNNCINIGSTSAGTGANSITLNATGLSAAPSTASAFGVYMSSNTTPDFEVIGGAGAESTLNSSLKITGQAYTELHANATNLVVSWDDGNIQTVTVNTSVPVFAPTDPKAGATYILIIEQGATPVTVDWNSLVKWPSATGVPTLSSVTGKIDVITLICYDDSTTNGLYYGSATLDLA